MEKAQKILCDSYIIPFAPYLSKPACELKDELLNDLYFLDRSNAFMKYRGNELARDKAFLVQREVGDANSSDPVPRYQRKYWYTGFQYKIMQHVRFIESNDSIRQIVDTINALDFFGTDVKEKASIHINHVIATKYMNGEDFIGFHNDKLKDIEPNSYIIILSLGAERELHFKENDSAQVVEKVVMKEGDLFLLGPETNRRYQHSIVKNTKQAVGVRVSLTMRNIKTVVDSTLKKYQKRDANKQETENQEDKEHEAKKRKIEQVQE